MRRPLPAVSIGCLFFLSASAWAQISLVHVTSCGPGAFPATTCTVPSTGTGNLICRWLGRNSGPTTTTIGSITDNVGNVYAEAGAARSTYSGSVVDIWFAKGSIAGATSIKVTPSVSVASAAVVIWEFSGVDPTAPLDASANLSNQPTTATPISPSVATVTANEVIIAIVDVANSVAGITAGNPFTTDSTLFSNGWAHLITSSTGTYSAQWNMSPAGTYASSTASFKAASKTGSGGTPLSPCDLNSDGVVNSTDVNLAINMVLSPTSCVANIEGANVCNVAVVQRVVNASLPGGTCAAAGNSHTVTLNWVASISSNVAGYNVYRGTVSGGPYAKLNSSSLVVGTTYTDSTVQSQQSYYYVATAVDSSGNESAYSNPPAQVVVPSP